MFDDYDYDDLRAQVKFDRRLRNKLMRHPDPRDPDYPLDDDNDIEEAEGHDYNG